MTAKVTCDRCSVAYTLVADTHTINNFTELLQVPWYTFPNYQFSISRDVWHLYKGRDYCASCWRAYQDYKAKLESKEDIDFVLEEKRKEEERERTEEENRAWKAMRADQFLEHLDRVAPPLKES